MLTVLHRKSDGSERVFEAESVTNSAPPGLYEIRATGVLMDDVPGNCVTLDISKPFGAVFVMNRFGATVARYTN